MSTDGKLKYDPVTGKLHAYPFTDLEEAKRGKLIFDVTQAPSYAVWENTRILLPSGFTRVGFPVTNLVFTYSNAEAKYYCTVSALSQIVWTGGGGGFLRYVQIYKDTGNWFVRVERGGANIDDSGSIGAEGITAILTHSIPPVNYYQAQGVFVSPVFGSFAFGPTVW